MKKLFYRMKYFWHSFQFNKSKTAIQQGIDSEQHKQLQYEMEYHEKAALQSVFKK